ncbi:MAG: hypothetical protein JSV05_03350 [Candidatus Bathyarchaeota archaeon]|nr:MAG: hypothetical protein JSV05_03350 [Candidatus Bathyarchaeota archaeon]
MRVIASTILWLFCCGLLLFPTVKCEIPLEYAIEVGSDGLAKWTIQCSSVLQSFETFISNVQSLVSEARIETGRNMSAARFAMTTNVSGSYTIVKYQFQWTMFAINETDRIKIGDVFEVAGLFLFGEGIVNIVHPAGYTVESVVPKEHEASTLTLTWWGIADFKSGEPKITLVQKKPLTFLELLQQNIFSVIGIIVLVGAGSGSLYFFRTKKHRKEIEKAGSQRLMEAIGAEGDEERIVSLLRNAGGQLRQSAIANQCRFSKSKTSILLSKMEGEGKVKRIERGRQKIVALIGKEERNAVED